MEGAQVIGAFRGDHSLAASKAPSQSFLEQEQGQELLLDREPLPLQTPSSNSDSIDSEEDKQQSPPSSEANTNTPVLTPPTRLRSHPSTDTLRSTESVAGSSASTEDFESWDAQESLLSTLDNSAEDSSITDFITVDSLSDEPTVDALGPHSVLRSLLPLIDFGGGGLNSEIWKRIFDPQKNMDPRAFWVLSTFDCHHESLSLKSGQRVSDSRSWTVGFDVRLFSQSLRNFPTSKPIHCPYKLRGTHHEYDAYGKAVNQWNRRREVAEPVMYILKRDNHEAPLAPEFEPIADAFFNGREVPLEFEEFELDNNTPNNTKAYEIHYKVGDYSKLLNMDLCDDKELFFFLQDCAMANQLETVYLQNGAASISSLLGYEGSIKIYRDDKHKKYSNLIAKADNYEIVPGNPTASGYTVIAILHHDIELRYSLGKLSLDATTSITDPLSDDELFKQLAGSVPQPPTEPPKPKKKKSAKKNKNALKQAVEATKPSADIQSDRDDKPLADALLAEVGLESKEFETGVLEVTKKYKSSLQQIVQGSSGKSFSLNGEGGTANSKAENGETGWETVKSRVHNKHRGTSAQVHNRPGISQKYSPRTPSLQVNPGNSLSQPPFQVSPSQHIPRGPAAKFHQRAMVGGETWNPGGAGSLQNKVATSSTAAMQSIPGSKNPRTPNKNQQINPGPVVAKQVLKSSERIFDPSEYPAMPSKLPVSNNDARANNPIAAHEVAQSFDEELPEDITNPSNPLTPQSRVESSLSVSSEQSLDVKQPVEEPGDFCVERDIVADTSTIISEIETSETPEPSVLAESEKTIDDPRGVYSSTQGDETIDDDSVGADAVEHPEFSLSVDHHNEIPEGSVDLIDDIHSDQHPANELVPQISGDSTQMTPEIQKIDQVSSQAGSEALTTPNEEKEEDPVNGRKHVDRQHEAHVEVTENQRAVPMARELSIVTNQPPLNNLPTFNNSVPPDYAFQRQPDWESPYLNVDIAHPPPTPFYQPLGDMSVGIIPPYVGAIPPEPLPYQSYSVGPQFHPFQLPPFTNYNRPGLNENSQPMTFGHFTSPDAPIRHPGEAQSGSPPQSAPYSPLVPTSLNMDVADTGEGADEPQPAAPDSASRCSYCLDPTTTDGRTLVFCPGCGPTCNIRYCSTACLLADSYDHSTRCMNFPASQRLAFHDLPLQFIYEKEPIMSISGLPQSPEQFRQKAYMMYCHSGPFPTTLAAWARRNSAESSLQGIDILERQKRTGDYHVFRSELTSVGPRCNAGADVIFTVFFQEGGPAKKIFNRSLNACFLTYRHEIVKFLFLFIRHFITDRGLFEMLPHQAGSTVVLEEFKYQFTREFGFDVTHYEHGSDIFDVDEECRRVEPLLTDLERKYPILIHWMK